MMYPPKSIKKVGNGQLDITFVCFDCKKDVTVRVLEAGWQARQEGALIQQAFPALSAGERELFVSGICSDCFDKMFPAPKAGRTPGGRKLPERYHALLVPCPLGSG